MRLGAAFLASTCVDPGSRAVARPPAVIDASAGFVLDHVTVAVRSSLLVSLNVPVAVY